MMKHSRGALFFKADTHFRLLPRVNNSKLLLLPIPILFDTTGIGTDTTTNTSIGTSLLKISSYIIMYFSASSHVYNAANYLHPQIAIATHVAHVAHVAHVVTDLSPSIYTSRIAVY